MRSLILIAHGSRDPRWLAPFERLRDDLQATLGEGAVAVCYLDHAPPSLAEAVDQVVARGADAVRVLPMFMSGGGHVDQDIPALVEAERRRRPGVRFEVLPAIGEHPRFAALIRAIATESA